MVSEGYERKALIINSNIEFLTSVNVFYDEHIGYEKRRITMIVTKKYIRDLKQKSLIEISEETEKRILEQFGKEPDPDDEGCKHTYTEQDLYEQIRKMIRN